MTGLEALHSVQYVTLRGKRFAVLSAEDWEAMLEWLETVEDAHVVKDALAELKSAGGDAEKAGWIRWDKVRRELK